MIFLFKIINDEFSTLVANSMVSSGHGSWNTTPALQIDNTKRRKIVLTAIIVGRYEWNSRMNFVWLYILRVRTERMHVRYVFFFPYTVWTMNEEEIRLFSFRFMSYTSKEDNNNSLFSYWLKRILSMNFQECRFISVGFILWAIEKTS
jgi:hypothetical protein